MNCEACGQAEASVQFTEVIGAQKRLRRLCSGCAHSEGLFINLNPTASLAAGDAAAPNEDAQLLRCPSCACSLEHLRRSGRVGCPDCYDAFWPQIVQLLVRVHGTTRHFGLPNRESCGARRAGLEGELEGALEEGDYLRAARIRDTLRALPPRGREAPE